MNSDPRSHKEASKPPAQHDESAEATQEDFNAVLDSFRRLVQAASDSGRDWKLIDALLHTMVDMVSETQGDLFESSDAQASVLSADAVTESLSEAAGEARVRLRPEYRLRLEAVIDSWSDDEAADFLMVTLRQVRRRAQQGALYYFVANRKRRYPVWQFDRFCSVVGGVAVLRKELPESWSASRVYEFMTTRSSVLGMVAPAQWLLMKRDPHQIAAAIASSVSARPGDCAPTDAP
ncbi:MULTISPECIES: hypothetical protein [unclassified Microbacterium]|uniref:hypothetical protein n=1 Tax=unclassified Microbacterium TaxID=2609290 RepID=UPI000EAA66FE|nr:MULTISPECIES: hypothetical protein [unclassified Microbacterium]MBT2486732.1 hypothetical protein [Microbacterium sp. ISL-108]RKN64664.1 hypothetical protein D7252_18720 [Microbacterium sp. CGR2]